MTRGRRARGRFAEAVLQQLFVDRYKFRSVNVRSLSTPPAPSSYASPYPPRTFFVRISLPPPHLPRTHLPTLAYGHSRCHGAPTWRACAAAAAPRADAAEPGWLVRRRAPPLPTYPPTRPPNVAPPPLLQARHRVGEVHALVGKYSWEALLALFAAQPPAP